MKVETAATISLPNCWNDEITVETKVETAETIPLNAVENAVKMEVAKVETTEIMLLKAVATAEPKVCKAPRISADNNCWSAGPIEENNVPIVLASPGHAAARAELTAVPRLEKTVPMVETIVLKAVPMLTANVVTEV